MRRALTVLSLLAGSLAFPALAAESHPFTIHDMLAMDRLSDPQLSPDGKRVLFNVSATDLEANRRRTDLYMVNADGSGLRRLTSSPAFEASARFSPDGRSVYFLSDRSGSSQVWRLPLDGGEAEQVTRLGTDVDGFLLSPDAQKLVLAMVTYPACETLACTEAMRQEKAKSKATGQLYDQLLFRHWDTWADGQRSHLFVWPMSGGEPLDLMKGMDAHAPSRPFGDMGEVTFAPDGKSLLFTAKDVGREEAWSTDYDLYQVPLDGSAKPRCLTESNQAWDTAPTFSPDGKSLAWLAMSRPRFEADRFRIMVRSWPDGKEREVASSWDRSAQTLVWSPNGKTLYTVADNLGQTSLFAVDVASGKVRTLVEKGTVSSPVAGGDKIIFGLDHLKSPVELFSVKADGSGLTQLTRVNQDKLAAARMGDAEQFTFKGAGGDTVYGYVVKPSDFDPAKKYPVAFLIHGGPQGSFGNHFHYRWNPQAYAGAGFAAVMVDFHGSTGYGQAFTDAIRGDWGGKPLEDLKAGLEAATQKYAWLDGNRAVALGASYGGYMINWIAGQWPDRFKALVVHDGNLDERLAYFDTEELWFPEWEHHGTPWENPDGYNKQNPIDYVKNWKTPTLVVHGGRDYRVVDTQGMSTFTALQRKGVPSRFLYFPNENHWVLKPANSILWHNTVLAWLKQWTS